MSAGQFVDFGGRTLVVRGRGYSERAQLRTIAVCIALVLATAAVGVITLGYGTLSLSPSEVVLALLDPDATRAHRLVVFEWRLPRFAFAALSGLALGMSGAIFQSITKNPLGSPDVIGFATGSYTGALVVMLWIGSTSYLATGAGALLGGAVVAVIVYLLAWKDGVGPFRLIIVGIGVSAVLGSVNALMMMKVSPEQAMLAAVWGAGSLSALGYAQLWPAALVFIVLAAWAVSLAHPLVALELGDDAATAVGVRGGRVRAAATIVGVALTALVTAAAGPIAFIALSAPQVARRLTRGASLQLMPAALTGMMLLTTADMVAQWVDLPVGVLTICVGGAYLAWLLMSEYNRGGRQ